MSLTKKKPIRPVRPLLEQRDYLLSRVEKFYKCKDRSKENYKKMWKNITQELNKIGPSKQIHQWKKLWSDAILKTRKKIRNSNGGPIRFSENDLRIIEIFGSEENLMCIYQRGFNNGKGSEKTSDSDDLKFFGTISLDDSHDDSHDELDDSDGNEINCEGSEKIHIDYSNNIDLDENPDDVYDLSKIPPNIAPTVSIKENPIEIIHIDKKPIIITESIINRANSCKTSSQIIDLEKSYNKEMLEIQKQTLNEIRQISKAQMETNNLLRNEVCQLSKAQLETNNLLRTLINKFK